MINLPAMTVCQPWAELIASGAKPIENRTWPLSKRWQGQDLAIHAGLSKDHFTDHAWGLVRHAQRDLPEPLQFVGPGDFVYGAIVCIVRVHCCVTSAVAKKHFRRDPETLRYIDDGGYCILLDQVRRLAEPVPCRGALGVWSVPEDVAVKVVAQIRRVA